MKMSIICEFCSKDFTTKSNLLYHQKTTKYCLEMQGKEIKENFYCQNCDKSFLSKYNLNRHVQACLEKEKEMDKDKEIQELKENNLLKNNELFFKDEYILKLETKIEKLENALIGMAESKNEIIDESFPEQIEKLTQKYGKKQTRQQIKEPNVIYILTTKSLKQDRRYIFGKSKNLTTRLSTYNKTDEHEVVYYQGCKTEGNMDIIEKMVLNKLDNYREVENRDRFILPEDKEIDFFIDVIKKNIQFILEN